MKKTRGKAAVPVTPRSRLGVIADRVEITVEDLRAAAEAAGFDIRTDADPGRVSRYLSRELSRYIVDIRGLESATTPSENAAWMTAVNRWAANGIELFEITATGGISLEAVRLLWTRMPNYESSDDFQALSQLLPALLGSSSDEPKPTRRPNIEIAWLVTACRAAFAELQADGLRFVVRTKNENERYGPAIDWCRSIFAAADRNADQKNVELSDLVRWAGRPDALASVIRRVVNRDRAKSPPKYPTTV